MNAQKALVVDDERGARVLLTKGAIDAGFEVDAAQDGAEAASLISQNFYDVVLTDLIMPGPVDGVGVLEAAKAKSTLTCVILITGYGSIESAVDAMRKGAEDYIQKPVHLDELAIKLERLRNLNELAKDSRDLREAMDVTEKNAAQTIGSLEGMIADLQKQLEKTRGVLLGDRMDADKRIEKALDILFKANF